MFISGFISSFCRSDTCEENANEFVGLFNEGSRQFAIFGERDFFDEFEPAMRFAEFLQTGSQAMNEITLRLGRFAFAMIGEWRGARPKELFSDVFSRIATFKAARQPDNIGRKVQKPFFQVVPWHKDFGVEVSGLEVRSSK